MNGYLYFAQSTGFVGADPPVNFCPIARLQSTASVCFVAGANAGGSGARAKLDAARALGLEAEIGSIEAGKRADLTILSTNPLETPGADWETIPVWGVVLDGVKHPLVE